MSRRARRHSGGLPAPTSARPVLLACLAALQGHECGLLPDASKPGSQTRPTSAASAALLMAFALGACRGAPVHDGERKLCGSRELTPLCTVSKRFQGSVQVPAWQRGVRAAACIWVRRRRMHLGAPSPPTSVNHKVYLRRLIPLRRVRPELHMTHASARAGRGVSRGGSTALMCEMTVLKRQRSLPALA